MYINHLVEKSDNAISYKLEIRLGVGLDFKYLTNKKAFCVLTMSVFLTCITNLLNQRL